MTPEEAIEMLRGMQNKKVDYAELVCAPAFASGYKYVYPEPEDYAIEEAISALKEIQQYREIGTVEEIKSVKKYIALKRRCGTPTNTIDLCAEYVAIGTVEECREAAEGRKAKKARFYAHNFYCPECGEIVGNNEFNWTNNFCRNCGQAIQWDANLEGMEDELR